MQCEWMCSRSVWVQTRTSQPSKYPASCRAASCAVRGSTSAPFGKLCTCLLYTSTAVETIKANSEAVKGSDDIARVGAVSSGDEAIGKLIAEAMEKVSASGVITIEESKTAETGLEVVEGMQFDRGYISPVSYTLLGAWELSTCCSAFLC